MSILELHMPRTRRSLSTLPHLRLAPKHKLNRATLNHHVFMLKPISTPLHPVNLHTLYIITLITQSLGQDTKSLVAVDGHVDILEPGTLKKIDWRGHDGIETEHLPDEPGVESAGVGVAGHAVWRVAKAERCEMRLVTDCGVGLTIDSSAHGTGSRSSTVC